MTAFFHGFLVLLFPVMLTGAGAGNGLADRAAARVDSMHDDLVELRRDLHRHPEVSGQEERTAGVVAKRLRAAGLEVRTGVGGHGVVAVLRGEKPGPVVAYRADMDAMASGAPDPVPFASETPGVRHICGHDVHTTVAVGIAEALASVRADLPGMVVFIFQPAEEIAEGAAAVIEDGALENPAPEAIFALHCAPLPVGQIAIGEGMLLAGIDLVRVTLSGGGNVDAAAEACKKAISAANGIGEGAGFTEAGVLSTEGDADTLIVTGMVRASSDERRLLAHQRIAQQIDAVEVAGVSTVLDIVDDAVPPVDNDAGLVGGAGTVLRTVLGDSAVVMIDEPTPSFSEDFSHFQRQIPGAMVFLGVSNAEKGIMGLPHHPMFAADEDAIGVGARAMAAVLIDYLESK